VVVFFTVGLAESYAHENGLAGRVWNLEELVGLLGAESYPGGNVMFFFARLALVTCAFYLGIAVLMDATSFAIARWRGGFGVYLTRPAWMVTFGLIWLLSFMLSWRFIMTPILARFPR
jgi:hypothetical protein